MARRDNKQLNQTMIHIVTALLSVAVVCLLALITYVTVLHFADRVEENQNAADSRESAGMFIDSGSGVGRDAVQVFALKGELPENSESGGTDGESGDGGENNSKLAEDGRLPVISPMVEINSVSALMIEKATGQVIYSVDPGRSQYPASLTKIMTAILGLEMQEDLNDVITITEEMYDGLIESGASLAGFDIGEEVRYIDLIYGMLLPSGAEAANAVAITCCGDIESFVEQMNEKAFELGMLHTEFTNVSGLHDVNMRTTAEDMMKLFTYALSNPTFKSIIGNSFYTTAPTNKHSAGITFNSTMFNMLTVTEFENGAVIKGGKTGTTTPAGQCLASYATIGDHEYILITLGAYGYGSDEYFNALDAMTLYSLVRTF